jgi:putative GTP pyrophosphokinase
VVPPPHTLAHSKTKINKSARLVRRFYGALQDRTSAEYDAFLADGDSVIDAITCVEDFRTYHARPLARVNAGLRHYVKKAGMRQPEVTQRLKRFATIIHKLQREPTMALSRMEDIAGVRAVLENQAQANAVRDMLIKARRWKIRRVRTYVEGGDPGPKADGYRAIHIIVEKDGCFVEIQLRTPWQDAWAQSVEQDTRRLRQDLKFGAGPDDLRQYYLVVSELFAMEEQGIQPDEGFMLDLANLYRETRRYFPEAPNP